MSHPETISEIKARLIALNRHRNILLFERINATEIESEINTYRALLRDAISSINSVDSSGTSLPLIPVHVESAREIEKPSNTVSIPKQTAKLLETPKSPKSTDSNAMNKMNEMNVMSECTASLTSMSRSRSPIPRALKSGQIVIYCNHFRDSSRSERCGFHVVTPLKGNHNQCKHRCHILRNTQNVKGRRWITRSKNRHFKRCAICHGEDVCIRDVDREEEKSYFESHPLWVQSVNPSVDLTVEVPVEQRTESQKSTMQSMDSIQIKPVQSEGEKAMESNEKSGEMSVSEEETESQSSSEEEDKRTMTVQEIRALSLDEKIALAMYLLGDWNEDEDWCRYCGSRWSRGYESSPWGPYKLCSRHYNEWKLRKLDLTKWKYEPKEPINADENDDERCLVRMIQRKLNSGLYRALPL